MPEVNLVKKVKTEAGWRFVPVEYHGNGKVKPDPRPHTFYLEWREDGKRKREAVGKLGYEAIARRELQYTAFLRDKKQSPRSVYNKFEIVMTFLKAQGVRGIVNRNDWPRYVEQEPEVYENDELEAFFKACDEEERVLFEAFLMTGMREQELMHVAWRDVDLTHTVVRVRHKPEYGQTPKGYKEREIPIPDRLIQSLKGWKEKADATCPLVFPNSNCSPNGHFLRMCKAVAKRAELSEDDFWLPKFRATFASWALRSGVDLRKVQMWMGHTDLESTMRYLKPNRGKAVREKVNAMFD